MVIGRSFRTSRPQPAGLTLVELILALALTVGLAGAVMGFYHQSTSLRESLLAQADFVAAQRSFMDQVTSELRGARRHRMTGITLEGGEMEMELVTTALPGPAVWVAPRITEQPPPVEHDLRLVGYRLGYEEDEAGNVFVSGLERTEQRRITAPVVEEGEEITVELLTDRIRFLRLRYWDGSAWITSFSGGDFPEAVEVTVGRRPLPEATTPEEYPYETFTRVVYIPAGGETPRGRGERGGGRQDADEFGEGGRW